MTGKIVKIGLGLLLVLAGVYGFFVVKNRGH